MNMRKEEAQEALNRSLSGLREDPRLAQRVIASEKGEFKVRKVSRAAIISATVVLLAMATALAAGLSGRVNWLGEIKSDPFFMPSATPMPTAAPETAAVAAEIDDSFYGLLDYSDDRDLIVISVSGNGAASTRKQMIGSMDDFKALMETAEADFPIPVRFPEGYVLKKGYVEFGCLPEGEYALASRTVHPEGFTESHYTVDPAMDFIRAYYLTFIPVGGSDDTGYVSVHVFMAPPSDPREYSFGIGEDQTARAVQAEGMEHALMIEGDRVRHLAMRKAMSSPQTDLFLIGADADLSRETYTEYEIDVSATALTEDELLKMFAK